MKIVELNTELEPLFWEHVNRDLPHYYFFAHDWRNFRSETEILLALGDGGSIEGMMLTYDNKIVQLRGTPESGRVLLEGLELDHVELQAPKYHKQYVLERYEPTWSKELVLMKVRKGQEKLQQNHEVVTLDESDAGQITAMLNGIQEFWRMDFTTEQCIEQMSTTTWAGIKINGEIASIGRMRLTGEVGHVPTVATHVAHRNRGYATSIVSYLVEHILEKLPVAIIYVLGDNAPAIKVYRRVGFKPYRKYLLMRGDMR